MIVLYSVRQPFAAMLILPQWRELINENNKGLAT